VFEITREQQVCVWNDYAKVSAVEGGAPERWGDRRPSSSTFHKVTDEVEGCSADQSADQLPVAAD
jgi:hypothetical protein